ncbi:MAG: hypothetical protein HYR56_18930 [Acidobacteria bacterium]|nr:hypothetical protein [Acidobacteriota bacterium]MBI3427233.1 hypothetical protein [Acidobacteriota bacterium]
MKLRKLLKRLGNSIPKKLGKKQEAVAVAVIEEAIESLKESELICIRKSCSNFALTKSNYCQVHLLARDSRARGSKAAAKKADGKGKLAKKRKK